MEDTKKAFLIIRIRPADKAELVRAANAAGARNTSTWIRNVLLAAARRWTDPAGG